MKFRPYGPAFSLKEEPKQKPKGKCKDCKHQRIVGILPLQGCSDYCTLHERYVLEWDWCYDYKRKWWKVWK